VLKNKEAIMKNEIILERLNRLEEKINPIADSAESIKELKEQLTPRVNEAVKALIVELVDIEDDFQLEDLVFFIKKVLRNINNFSFAIDQLKNLIDFAIAVEPLLKTTVPQIIASLDELEQKGLLRIFSHVPSNIDLRNSKDVSMFGLVKALGDPKIKSGMGVLLELTKGLAAMKNEQVQ
jgi:uncharacterized protein YjgD (DUF1641 family)